MSFVSWTKLTVKELQDLCETCGFSTGGNKEELSDRLQGYFEKRKGKLPEKLQENEVKTREFPEEDMDGFNGRTFANNPVIDLEGDYLKDGSQEADCSVRDEFAARSQEKDRVEPFSVDIFMFALSKMEKKIDKNFSALQREMEEGELLDEAWPSIKLSKPHNQHEYDFLAKIGKCLDRAIKVLQVSARKEFIGIREEIETHAVTLRLADNKGWRTALQIVGSSDRMMEKYKDHILIFSNSWLDSCFSRWKYSDKARNNQHKRKRSKDRQSPSSSDSEGDELYRRKENLVGQDSQLHASTAEVLVILPLIVPSQVQRPLANLKTLIDYTQAPSLKEYTIPMESTGPPPVVMDWLVNGIPLFSRGVLVLAVQPVPNQYSLSAEQREWVVEETNRLLKTSAIRVFRQGRTMKEPQLAVSSSKDRLIDMLLARAYDLRKNSVSHGWNQLSREHLEAQLLDLTKDYKVRKVFKALLKEHRKDREPEWPCDPLPVNALKHFIDNKPPYISEEFWVRDSALVAIGLRTMRHPGELCKIRCKDIKIRKKMCWIQISSSKTDQFANGKFIPIEYSDSRYCPAKLLIRYLRIRPSVDDHFTAHSIRIGGATAAMEAGLSLTQIQTIGGWDSKAVMLYLRTVGT
ncbi:17672_t:CDS:2, partial [Cetraspora pellucida]